MSEGTTKPPTVNGNDPPVVIEAHNIGKSWLSKNWGVGFLTRISRNLGCPKGTF